MLSIFEYQTSLGREWIDDELFIGFHIHGKGETNKRLSTRKSVSKSMNILIKFKVHISITCVAKDYQILQ